MLSKPLPFKKPKSVFKVKELIVLSNVDEEHLIRLLNNGPVAISIVYHVDFAKFTGDGIYEGHGEDTPDLGYHMLLCSGYGTLNGVHYFKVQNSAGLIGETWDSER
ncbi:unnamed protein product [Arabis nemorensis]|uniref:Peptidase C1A papain C-terminal domain-containing protein n=1 Tax=Arabis nemorensis TaxID=586526 RepID=A0A565AWZ6_9BRAS|nr:unnamed protein product [Arabis nemorensis]